MKPAALVPSFAPAILRTADSPALQRGETAALVDLGKELFPYLLTVSDPRGRQGRRYTLAVLLVLYVAGFCTGCQGYLSVARWVCDLRPEVLREFGLLSGRTPCAATWLDLFRLLDWDQVADQFHAWAEAALLAPGAPPATPPPYPHPPHHSSPSAR